MLDGMHASPQRKCHINICGSSLVWPRCAEVPSTATFCSLKLCVHVFLGHLLGATGLFPNLSNTVGLFAATDTDTLFISHHDMKTDPEAHVVILSVALAITSSELSVSRRKTVQLRQTYPIPAFDDDGWLQVSKASGELAKTFAGKALKMVDRFMHGEYQSIDDDQNGVDTEGNYDDKAIYKLRSRSERINLGARSKLFATMVC